MVKRAWLLGLGLALAACGGGGGEKSRAAPGEVDVCALIAAPEALFGADAEIIGGAGDDAMAGVCQWQSADGRRGGDAIVYTAHSLGDVTLDARMAEIVAAWDGLTETPLAPVEGLGEAAQIAIDLPGYQTQIVFKKGDRLVLILGRSGDPALEGEALARAMASAIASAP